MKAKIIILFLFVSIVTFSLTGCATSIYGWEGYPDQIYANLRGDVSLESQLQALEKDLQKILSKNKKVPPGLYAHIGMLQAEVGNRDRARECFNEEKNLFPESAVFMDRLLSRLGR